jgi:hypothetical protein
LEEAPRAGKPNHPRNAADNDADDRSPQGRTMEKVEKHYRTATSKKNLPTP